MTYFYYRSTTSTSEPKISDKTMAEWKHLAEKKNWRITQLPNGYYQTEVNSPDQEDKWVDITRERQWKARKTQLKVVLSTFPRK